MNIYPSLHNPPYLLQCLSRKGYVFVQLEARDSTALGRQLLELAKTLGRPQATRGKDPLDRLVPQKKEQAHVKSLSAQTGLAEQPWHIDLAHCQVPARYIALACEREGGKPVPTELTYWNNLLSMDDHEASHTEPFLVRNGRGSFYATLLTQDQKFLRFDPGCMQPTTQRSKSLLSKLCRKNVEPTIRINWQPGLAVIFDNWRMLHRRLDAHDAEDRILLRVSVMEENKK